MLEVYSFDLKDLWENKFIQYIKRRRSYFLSKLISDYGVLLIPINESINFNVHYSDIRNHVFRRSNMIHYENKRKNTITKIGNEIRTEKGYSEFRIVHVVQSFSFSFNEAKSLFSLRCNSPHPELHIYVITGSLTSGLVFPASNEQLSDIQASHILQMLSICTGITPILDSVKECIDTNDNLLSLCQPLVKQDTSMETQKRFEQFLRSKGREILFQCKKESQLICSRFKAYSPYQSLICYSLHHFCMQLISPYLSNMITTHCQHDIQLFEQSWKVAQNLSMDELHISPQFQFNFSDALIQLNESYFTLNNHPQCVMPFTILEIWDRLLSDIRYIINTEITNKNLFSSEELKTITVSTDDLIGIVTYIFLHTDLIHVIPAHLILVDAFCPFDISVTAPGYSYSVIETAVMWINDYAKTKCTIDCL